MSVHTIAQQGKRAWDEHGQFTEPELVPEDPDGRAALYIAGFLAGYMTREMLCMEPCCVREREMNDPAYRARWTQRTRGAE